MSKRNLFEYRRPITLGAQGLLIDDVITGFEDSILRWSSGTAGSGVITVITTDAYHGTHCLQIDSPTLASAADIYRSIARATTGKHRMIAYVKVITYYGTTANDYQVFSAQNYSTQKHVAAFLISATDVKVIHHNTTIQVSTTPLETGVWHKLEAEIDFDALRTRFWIDDVLAGDYTDVTLIQPTWLHVGDISQSVGRGKFYWDTILYGAIIE
jgi:hypothetical protein